MDNIFSLTFLGTGTSTGVPILTCSCPVCSSSDSRDARLRTSALIRWQEKVFLIDAGPDFRQQMLRERAERLDGVLITHEHRDHIGGLDDIRPYNFATGQATKIYGEQRALEGIKRDFSYVFVKHEYPGLPQMELVALNGSAFELDGLQVQPIRCMHLRLPIFGFKIGGLAYLTDVNSIEQCEKDKIMGIDTLVINALGYKPHISHFNLEQALELIGEIKPRRAYLTHIGHGLGLHEELTQILPSGVHPAYDGLTIEITTNV